MIKATSLRSFANKSWPVLTILAIVIFALLIDPMEDSVGLRIVGVIGLSCLYLSAAITILKAVQTMLEPSIHRSWRFVSIGLILWLFAYLIEVAIQLISSQRLPIPSVVDLVRYAGLIGITVGFAIYPETREKVFGRVRALFDISILCVGVVIIFWIILLRPILLIGLVNTITAVWVEARVGFDLIWLILLLRLFLNSKDHKERVIFLFFGIGAFIHALVDSFSGFEKINVIQLSHEALEAGWMVGGFLILYGSSQLINETELLISQSRISKLQLPFRFEQLLPTAVTYLVIGFIALDWLITGQLDRVVLPMLLLLGFLLITRQGAIAGQSEIRQHAELVNSTTDFAFTFDSKGIIRLANPALQSLLGLDPDQKSLSNITDFVRVNVSMNEILAVASDMGWSGEAQFFHMDGTTLPVSLSIKRIQDEGRGPQIFAAIAHDLTETKLREVELRNALQQLAETEEDLRRLNRELETKVEDRTQELEDMVSHLAQLNEELQALDQLKSDFVALVSHELRAPLTNIRTGLEVLLRGAPELVQNAQESLELILREAERLSSFVEMILDLSAIEAGRFDLQVRPLSVLKVIEDVALRLPNQSMAERMKINVEEDASLAMADEQALHSIFFHLIDNALKYAPEGEVEVSAKEEEKRLLMQVIDEGPGIPEEERERVFEMFYRLDTSDSRKVYGRGLGLNLAQRFLDLMGGGIQIRGGEKGGTIVEFWLPKVDVEG